MNGFLKSLQCVMVKKFKCVAVCTVDYFFRYINRCDEELASIDSLNKLKSSLMRTTNDKSNNRCDILKGQNESEWNEFKSSGFGENTKFLFPSSLSLSLSLALSSLSFASSLTSIISCSTSLSLSLFVSLIFVSLSATPSPFLSRTRVELQHS